MPERSTATIRVHDLVGRRVVTADDRTLGRVVDLEIEHGDGFSVVAIELGRFGLLERIGLLRILGRQRAPQTVPWRSVERVDARAVWLHAGARTAGARCRQQGGGKH